MVYCVGQRCTLEVECPDADAMKVCGDGLPECCSMQKHSGHVMAMHVAEDVCAPVAHRQLVFTIPKRFRLFFRYDRTLLGDLARAAWETVRDVHRAVLGREDVVPGAVAGIQTFGQLIHWHPHIHALVTEGAFTPAGTFLPLPEIESEPFLRLWEHKVFRLLLDAERIDQDVVENMRSWRHSGFSVDRSVFLEAGDTAGIERLAQYMVRCPFSISRVLRLTDEGKVIYRADKRGPQRFPDPGRADLAAGTSRNFQVFDALDFIAEVTQHVPDKGEHLVRYYGWYSNKSRGMRAKAQREADGEDDASCVARAQDDSPGDREARRRWAALIQRIFEVDPLECPECGGTMRVISFIERRQRDVIERILRHCELWDPPTRGPPAADEAAGEAGDLQVELDPEYQQWLWESREAG